MEALENCMPFDLVISFLVIYTMEIYTKEARVNKGLKHFTVFNKEKFETSFRTIIIWKHV